MDINKSWIKRYPPDSYGTSRWPMCIELCLVKIQKIIAIELNLMKLLGLRCNLNESNIFVIYSSSWQCLHWRVFSQQFFLWKPTALSRETNSWEIWRWRPARTWNSSTSIQMFFFGWNSIHREHLLFASCFLKMKIRFECLCLFLVQKGRQVTPSLRRERNR
jgi:hypothetical protein